MTLRSRGVVVVIVAQASGSLRIIEDLFQNRVTINAGQSIVEVGETIVLFGQGVSPPDPGFRVSIVEENSSDDFIAEDINEENNEFRFPLRPTEPGGLCFFLEAGVPDIISIFLVSRTIAVQVVPNRNVHKFLWRPMHREQRARVIP